MSAGRVVRKETEGVYKATGANTDGRFEFMILDVRYGFGPPLHVHDAQEDTFYVLDGVLTAQIGEEIIELKEGDFASAPPGVAHTFTNASQNQVARMVNVMTPGIGFDHYITAAMSGADQAEMERLAKEYGVSIVGPTLAEKLGLD